MFFLLGRQSTSWPPHGRDTLRASRRRRRIKIDDVAREKRDGAAARLEIRDFDTDSVELVIADVENAHAVSRRREPGFDPKVRGLQKAQSPRLLAAREREVEVGRRVVQPRPKVNLGDDVLPRTSKDRVVGGADEMFPRRIDPASVRQEPDILRL